MNIIVRPVQEHEFDQWQQLFLGYCDFYKTQSDINHRKQVWQWLFDENHVSECYVALKDDELVGFMHFREMPSQLRGCNIGFLDDLYVNPDYRKQGIAEQLLNQLKFIANERQWPTLRWLTAENNYKARSFYDKIGYNSGFLAYGMNP